MGVLYYYNEKGWWIPYYIDNFVPDKMFSLSVGRNQNWSKNQANNTAFEHLVPSQTQTKMFIVICQYSKTIGLLLVKSVLKI